MNNRIQQIAIGILTVLSLLASSVAACTCSHHEAEVKPQAPSCHHHSEMSEMAESGVSAVENTSDNLASDEDCVCAETAQKVVAKFETIKLKKQAAAVTLEAPVSIAVRPVQTSVGVAFAKPSYLSDSFYNLAPKRGLLVSKTNSKL